MGIRKKIIKYNIINFLRQRKCRKSLRHNITIFASNCMGGILYNYYGQRFLSPTVNIMFYSPDFVKLVCNPLKYFNAPLRFVPSEEPFPVALADDITIHFVHYHTNEEAEAKWRERIKRIDWDNVFVILNDRDGMCDKDYQALANSGYKNILVFTAKKLKQYPFTFQLKCFKDNDVVGNTMQKSILTGEMPVQKEFDFTAWFNQEKGNNLENYRK